MLIPRNLASGIVGFVSQDVSRYQLCGVYLEREADGKARATATSGKVLMTATWKDTPEEYPQIPGMASVLPEAGFHAIVPTAALVSAAKACPRKHYKEILNNIAVQETGSNGTIRIGTTDLDSPSVQTVRTVDGMYPQIKNCLPDENAKGYVGVKLDPTLLKEFVVAIEKTIGKDFKGCVQFYFHPEKPGIAEFESDGVKVKAMIMPLVFSK